MRLLDIHIPRDLPQTPLGRTVMRLSASLQNRRLQVRVLPALLQRLAPKADEYRVCGRCGRPFPTSPIDYERPQKTPIPDIHIPRDLPREGTRRHVYLHQRRLERHKLGQQAYALRVLGYTWPAITIKLGMRMDEARKGSPAIYCARDYAYAHQKLWPVHRPGTATAVANAQERAEAERAAKKASQTKTREIVLRPHDPTKPLTHDWEWIAAETRETFADAYHTHRLEHNL